LLHAPSRYLCQELPRDSIGCGLICRKQDMGAMLYAQHMEQGLARKLMARETLLALLVVALTFLNFGHVGAVFAAGGRVVVTGTSICGDPVSPGAGDHFACHACRSNTAALPPPPAVVAPVVFAATPVAYTHGVAQIDVVRCLVAARPRAPPVF
jgi:hypothetical protein